MDHIAAIYTTNDDLETIGGKGQSLARMSRAGFDVPGGFHLTADAYRHFISTHGLQDKVVALAKPTVVNGRSSFDEASEDITQLMAKCEIPSEIVAALTSAYEGLEGDLPAVAVRSSANAEDLPGLSFAGQQETFLNVRGADNVVKAVQECWTSLWTARAIAYRHEMGVPQEVVAMSVVVQQMVPAEAAGILFTANPATGERGEMIINASFGLGEAVVGGQVTPDTYIFDRNKMAVSETTIGPKEHQIIADGEQGTKLADVPEADRGRSSLADDSIMALAELATKVEAHFEGRPQDIEWAIVDGRISLLQSRPITNLPPQPIEVVWEPPEGIKALVRRQLIENFADPVTPLCDDLYIHEGLKSRKGGRSSFTTLNGFAFQIAGFSEQQTEEEFRQAIYDQRMAIAATPEGMAQEQHDLEMFVAELEGDEQTEFKAWAKTHDGKLAHDVTMPESRNPTYVANNKTAGNEKQIEDWRDRALPELLGCAEKWRGVHPAEVSDQQLLDAMTELARAEGWYWSSNAGHTFGVGKSTDDHLQCFLRETLPDHQFTSGQFLSGFKSKIMKANEDLYGICKLVRANDALLETVVTTPASRLQSVLESHPDAGPILTALDEYLVLYGHQGFNLDFGETTQVEDPTPLLVTLKNMVARPDYDSSKHEKDARKKREKAMKEITELLDGLAYWQFRYRLWFTNRYYPIREETCFVLGTCWPVLRGLGNELGRRLADDNTLSQSDDIYYLVSDEIGQAIEARKDGRNDLDFRAIVAERRELREARKRLHPPGTIPPEASQNPGVAFKETQTVNDPNSAVLNGIPVSPGTMEEAASVIMNVDEFDKMEPGAILVCPMTTPAWTQLFAHASGLVTDIGGILGHGSIVAREYGIPAVVGTGTGTQRIKHGQVIEIDGDAGTIDLKDED